MSLSRRVGSGAVRQLAARLCSAGVSFLITAVVLARVLPEREYGRFNFWLTAFLLALALVDFGVNRAAIRLIAAGEAGGAEIVRVATRMKTLVSCVAYCVFVVLAFAIEDTFEARAWIALASAHVLTHGLGAGSVPFEVAVDFRVPALAVIVGAGAFLAGGLALAAAHVDSAEPYLVVHGASLAIQNVFLYRHGSRATMTTGADITFARLAREALPLGLSAMAIAIYYYSDTLLLRPLRGEEDVARYSVAYRLMSFALMVPVLGSQVLFPVFTRCAARSSELLGRGVRRATFYFAYAAATVLAVSTVLAEPILALVFGERYRDSADVLRLLSVAMAVVYLTYPHTTALIAAGRAATFTRITVVSAILNVAANLVLIPRYGPIGAATSTLATELFVFACGVTCLWRHRRIHGFGGGLAAALVAFVVTVTVLVVTRERLPFPALLALGIALPAALAVPLRVWPFDLRVGDEELA